MDNARIVACKIRKYQPLMNVFSHEINPVCFGCMLPISLPLMSKQEQDEA